MKALVLTEYNHFEIQELPKPTPGPNDVLVRVQAVGICGSDVHGMDGSSGRRVPPIVMGHEGQRHHCRSRQQRPKLGHRRPRHFRLDRL